MRGPLYLTAQRVSLGVVDHCFFHAHTMPVTCAKNLRPYRATKFAARGFTEVAAKVWAQYGIRVNSVYLLDINALKPNR